MASSGSTTVRVTDYDDLIFSWEQVSQSVTTNTTTINWYLKLTARNYGGIINATKQYCAVNINGGSNIEGYASVAIKDGETKILASGRKDIPHNSDGTKTFSYSFYQDFKITFGNVYIERISGQGSGELNPISRHATITKVAPDTFNDEQQPTITISNPAGSNVTNLEAGLYFKSNPGTILAKRTLSTTATSCQFTFSANELTTMYNLKKTKKTATVIFYVKSTIGTSTQTSKSAETIFTIKDSPPTMSPVVEDFEVKSQELIQDENVIVKGINYPKVKFNAVANKGAEIKTKIVKCLGKTYTPFSAGDWDGYFENVESPIFVFTVTDTRGLSTTQTVTKDFVDYFKPTLDNVSPAVNIDYNTNKATVTCSVSGHIYYDESDEPTLINNGALYYRYKLNGQTPGGTGWVSQPLYNTSSTFSSSYTLVSRSYNSAGGEMGSGSSTNEPMLFDLGDTITLQIILTDAFNLDIYDLATHEPLETAILFEKKIPIQPIFDWSSSDFAFHVPVSMEEASIDTLAVNNLAVGGLSIGGGELIGYGYIASNTGRSAIAAGTTTKMSDVFSDSSGNPTQTHNIETYINKTIMDFSSGTFRVYPKNIVGMVEVDVMLSGNFANNCPGIWWRGNGNDFSDAKNSVTLLGYEGDGRGCLSGTSGGYDTAVTKYIYKIDSSTTFSDDNYFYVNPSFIPYSTGTFTPQAGSVKTIMLVKLYSKRGA